MTSSNEPSLAGSPVGILTFTTLYPSRARPIHGVFVENRLRYLLADAAVAARVVAPVPWIPGKLPVARANSDLRATPSSEIRHGIEITHPRYALVPRVGMTSAPALLFAGVLRHIRRLQQKRDFDLIDAHYFYPDGVAAVLLGRALGKPVVITARGTDINLIPKHFLPRRMIRWAALRAAGIIAVSQALKDAMADLAIPAEKITVLRNGVDLHMFKPGDRQAARRELGVSGKVLLSVGHLIERKGHALAIAALDRIPDYTLLIAGSGPEQTRLEALAASLGVADRVRFLGTVAHSDLRRYYLAADALVLASSREGWPNVLLEAMACGTPVIASPIWGNPEVVSAPEAGLLMQDQSAGSVAGAVQKLFSALPRREDTRAFAEGFSWDETSAGQLRLFRQILARENHAAPANVRHTAG